MMLAALSAVSVGAAVGIDGTQTPVDTGSVAAPRVMREPHAVRARAQEQAAKADTFSVSAEPGEWLARRLDAVRDGSKLWRDPERHRIQVLVSRVDDQGRVQTAGYRADAEFFYPASAIKSFVAVAALDRLAELEREHDELSLDTPLRLCRTGEETCRLTADLTNVTTKRITLGHELRKMQLVSSNVAFNRLYDFVGHERLNTFFAGMGLTSLRIRARFQGGTEGGRVSPAMQLGTVRIPERKSALALGPAVASRTDLGEAHYDDGGTLQKRPMDFRFKNYASLADLHRLMMGIARPDLATAPALRLREDHRKFLVTAMSEDPRASRNPELPSSRYDIERFKPLLAGARRVHGADNLHCVSKSGRAYGFEVDNAYLENVATGAGMFVTVAVHANPNRVINDNGYAYHLTRDFVVALGEELARAGL